MLLELDRDMTRRCKSCARILTVEHLITDKLGGYELQICLECIIAAFEEVLRESGVLPESVKPTSEAA